MPEHILVLGANGFVGRHLLRSLQGQGHQVVALMRHAHRVPEGIPSHISDFDTPEAYATLLPQARLIIHAASGSTPGSTAGKPQAEISANLRPTLALLEALQHAPHCQLLYLSSGGTLYGDTHAHPARETDMPRPRSYYGASKAAAEHFIHAAAEQFQLAATLLRPANLYGPGQGLRSGFGIIPTAFAHAKNGTPLTVWGDGSAIRDYLYIDDFIQLCTELAAQPMPVGARILNVASGQGISLMELIDTIRRVTGAALPLRHDLSRTVDIARIELDITPVTRHYGWAPEIALDEGLRRSWHWWQAQPT